MKVTVTPEALAPAYPKVMRHVHPPYTIVIFTAEGEGLCIYPEDQADFNTLSSGWVSHGWKPCRVTLDSTGE